MNNYVNKLDNLDEMEYSKKDTNYWNELKKKEKIWIYL